jgi:hypothetical protein
MAVGCKEPKADLMSVSLLEQIGGCAKGIVGRQWALDVLSAWFGANFRRTGPYVRNA